MAQACTDESSVVTADGIGHSFRFNYSKMKEMQNGECICTPTFRSGGYEWALQCYPQSVPDCFVSFFLCLLSDSRKVIVSFDLAILDKNRERMLSERSACTFRKRGMIGGSVTLIRASELERQRVLDGWFVVLCTISSDAICKEMSEGCLMLKDISQLTEKNEMVDVKFSVEGEIFEAHRLILGARSAVFKAELFGSMTEKEMEVIPIKDMQAVVFKALLQFLYTDSLPGEVSFGVIQDLLVAADRYAIEGLVARCQGWLLNNMSIDTVVDLLIISDQHEFSKMKKGCLKFMSKQENLLKLALTKLYGKMIYYHRSLLKDLKKTFINANP